MSTESQERAFRIAYALMSLGVSHDGVDRLTRNYSYDLIELQLKYLPYRKAKRPEAMIIESIRRNYSAPKDYFYASHQTESEVHNPVDQGSQLPARHLAPDASGYGTEAPSRLASADGWLEPGGPGRDLALPDADEADGQGE